MLLRTHTILIQYIIVLKFFNKHLLFEPDEFTSSGSVTDIDCNGNESGAIDLALMVVLLITFMLGLRQVMIRIVQLLKI